MLCSFCEFIRAKEQYGNVAGFSLELPDLSEEELKDFTKDFKASTTHEQLLVITAACATSERCSQEDSTANVDVPVQALVRSMNVGEFTVWVTVASCLQSLQWSLMHGHTAQVKVHSSLKSFFIFLFLCLCQIHTCMAYLGIEGPSAQEVSF